MDLRVSVEVAHTLDVYHNQLMSGTLKCEVAEGLGVGQGGDRDSKVTDHKRPGCGLLDTGQPPPRRGCNTPALPMVGPFSARRGCREERIKGGALFNPAGTLGLRTEAGWVVLFQNLPQGGSMRLEDPLGVRLTPTGTLPSRGLTCGVRRMLSSRTKPELELYLMYLPSI